VDRQLRAAWIAAIQYYGFLPRVDGVAPEEQGARLRRSA
jgi:hypothetical protein